MNKILQAFIKRPLFLFIIFYFIIRLTNLVLLPIFNDESIYIDWGYRMTHSAGHLYYSLYDAKQPLMLWLFGIFGSFIKDPLFAARLVSLLFGLFSMIGIYKLSSFIFKQKTAILATILYITIPIFVFYDRQALLESGVITAGIWSSYFLLKFLKSGKAKYIYFLGVILGIGFFIKTTSALFLIASFFVLARHLVITRKIRFLKTIGILLGIFLAVNILLIINPQFWETLPSNNRYVYTFNDLLAFPFGAWVRNLLAVLEISFVFLTPLVFLSSLLGVYFLLKKGHLDLIIFFLLPIVIHVLTVRIPSQRYLVALLPLAVIFSAYFVVKFFSKHKSIFYLTSVILIALPLTFSLIQTYSPIKYFTLTKNISKFSDYEGYINGQTSGYGVKEAIDYLRSISKNKKIIVAYAVNSGNPESGIIVYLQNDYSMFHAYLGRDMLGEALNDKDCITLTSGQEIYFVSRNDQVAGLENYMEKIKAFPKPNNNEVFVGIYHMKNKCDNPLVVDPQKVD